MSKIVLANWKMNLDLKSSTALAAKLADKLSKKPLSKLEIALCPSFPALSPVQAVINDIKSELLLGAQDCFWEDTGAFTSAVSPKILKEIGCRYVILGHSEKRQLMNETDEMINKKLLAVIKNGLIPVVCVGETWDERRAGHQDLALLRQVKSALDSLEPASIKKLIIAYEPVWVIGTGQAISPDQAHYASDVIRQQVGDSLGSSIVASKLKILYGGSVCADNVSDFLSDSHLDGVLVGNKSLTLADFYPLLEKISLL